MVSEYVNHRVGICVLKRKIDPIIVVALRAHLKPKLTSCNDTLWINVQTTRLCINLKISLIQ